MIIKTQTPSRLSIFGGGTDLPSFSDRYGGISINLAINIRTNITLYTGDDIFQSNTKLPYNADPQLCYAVLKELGIGSMHLASVVSNYDGYLKSGIGSSSSFVTGLLGAYRGLVDKTSLALQAYSIESKYHTTGKQDILASIYGGMNVFAFKRDQSTEVITLPRGVSEQFEKYIVLYWMGERKDCLFSISSHHSRKTDSLKKIKEIALIGQQALIDGRMEIVGKLLHASWVEKVKMGASTPLINELYLRGIKNGAMAGKLMGSGGGGYMYFFVSPEKRDNFIKKMNLEVIDFSTDYQGIDRRIL